MERKNEILDLSFQFALEIIKYCEVLENQRRYVIAQQLLKAGTSIGANVREAQRPHSRNDFVAKLVIAAKEADETEYWLLLCDQSDNYPSAKQLLDKIVPIKKLLSRIISSSKRNGR
ncbi:MAG: four helix bundle protein [Saprospiraceae bacterium]|nr:four helix bundle protein [Lewinella sp.]